MLYNSDCFGLWFSLALLEMYTFLQNCSLNYITELHLVHAEERDGVLLSIVFKCLAQSLHTEILTEIYSDFYGVLGHVEAS